MEPGDCQTVGVKELTGDDALRVNPVAGSHRRVTVATRDTRFGQRTVGRLDRTINLDVRGFGWEMRFNEGDFS